MFSNIYKSPDDLARWGDKRKLRNPTAQELKESRQLTMAVVECTRSELRKKDFVWKDHKIVGIQLKGFNLEYLLGDCRIYNAMAKRFGWKRRAVILVRTPLRGTEKVLLEAKKLLDSLFKRESKQRRWHPEFSVHLDDWSNMPRPENRGIYFDGGLKYGLRILKAAEVERMTPAEFLEHEMAKRESDFAEIRKRLRNRRPKLRLVGKAVA